MLVDGKAIAKELRENLVLTMKRLPHPPTLAVVVTVDTLVTTSYVELKQKVAKELGIKADIIRPKMFGSTEDLVRELLSATRTHDGIVLQLPLARNYDLDVLLKMLPITHDVDVIGVTSYQQFVEGKLPIMPPVVSAMSEILFRNGIRLAGRKVVVLGEGRLVGKPAADWARRMGATVESYNHETFQSITDLSHADVLLLGAGSPGIIKPEMVKEGVIIMDAGSSEDGGKVVGDADPLCAEKAQLLTPVPGGVGPVAIAKLFENLVALTALKEGVDLRL